MKIIGGILDAIEIAQDFIDLGLVPFRNEFSRMLFNGRDWKIPNFWDPAKYYHVLFKFGFEIIRRRSLLEIHRE